MKLSIVTTLYNSAAHLEEFYQRLMAVVRPITDDYEIVMVNDGATDASLQIALGLSARDPKITVVDLSRNFGEHKARMTGLSYATGEHIFLIQCDLETPPECLTVFMQELLTDTDTDMVYGVHHKGRGKWFERFKRKLIYYVFNLISNVKIPENQVACRLMTRRFVDALLLHREQAVFFAGLCVLTGFKQKACMVIKNRTTKSTYGWRRNIIMALDGIISFSPVPLILIFYLGGLICAATFCYIAIIIIGKLFFDMGISGWSSLIVAVCFFGGLITASIGLVGIYLSYIFLETKHRPYTIVKHVYDEHASRAER